MYLGIIALLCITSLQCVRSRPNPDGGFTGAPGFAGGFTGAPGVIPLSMPGLAPQVSLSGPIDGNNYQARQFMPAIIIVQNLPSNFASMMAGGFSLQQPNPSPSVPQQSLPLAVASELMPTANQRLSHAVSETRFSASSSIAMNSANFKERKSPVNKSSLRVSKIKASPPIGAYENGSEGGRPGSLLEPVSTALFNQSLLDDESFDSAADFNDVPEVTGDHTAELAKQHADSGELMGDDSPTKMQLASRVGHGDAADAAFLSNHRHAVQFQDLKRNSYLPDQSVNISVKTLKDSSHSIAVNFNKTVDNFKNSQEKHRLLKSSSSASVLNEKSSSLLTQNVHQNARPILGDALTAKASVYKGDLQSSPSRLRVKLKFKGIVNASHSSAMLNEQTLPFSNPKPSSSRRNLCVREQKLLPCAEKRKLIIRVRSRYKGTNGNPKSELAQKASPKQDIGKRKSNPLETITSTSVPAATDDAKFSQFHVEYRPELANMETQTKLVDDSRNSGETPVAEYSPASETQTKLADDAKEMQEPASLEATSPDLETKSKLISDSAISGEPSDFAAALPELESKAKLKIDSTKSDDTSSSAATLPDLETKSMSISDSTKSEESSSLEATSPDLDTKSKSIVNSRKTDKPSSLEDDSEEQSGHVLMVVES